MSRVPRPAAHRSLTASSSWVEDTLISAQSSLRWRTSSLRAGPSSSWIVCRTRSARRRNRARSRGAISNRSASPSERAFAREPHSMERRELLRFLAASAGLSCIDGFTPEQLLAVGRSVHAHAADPQRARVLDAHANATVVAAAERIIPQTDTPGATDAAGHLFIDRMLGDWYPPSERDRLLEGLRELDGRARSRHARDFVSCTEANQVALLEEVHAEVNSLRGPAAAQRRAQLGITTANEHWFALLKYL